MAKNESENEHRGCDITVTQVWVEDRNGVRCQESRIHCDTHNVDLS